MAQAPPKKIVVELLLAPPRQNPAVKRGDRMPRRVFHVEHLLAQMRMVRITPRAGHIKCGVDF